MPEQDCGRRQHARVLVERRDGEGTYAARAHFVEEDEDGDEVRYVSYRTSVSGLTCHRQCSLNLPRILKIFMLGRVGAADGAQKVRTVRTGHCSPLRPVEG